MGNETTELMEPLGEDISGIIEKVGRRSAKATITYAFYIQVRHLSPFDLELDNRALNIIN
jgi:replication factor A3